MSVVSSPLQVAGKLPRPLPWGGVVAGAELTATSDAAITPVTAIRLLLTMVLLAEGSAEQGSATGFVSSRVAHISLPPRVVAFGRGLQPDTPSIHSSGFNLVAPRSRLATPTPCVLVALVTGAVVGPDTANEPVDHRPAVASEWQDSNRRTRTQTGCPTSLGSNGGSTGRWLARARRVAPPSSSPRCRP